MNKSIKKNIFQFDLYEGREQSGLKHYFLETYLEKLVYKIGSTGEVTINYVDGFAGPWEIKDENGDDCSPVIAIKKLQKIQSELMARNIKLDFRCLFIEKDQDSFDKLKALTSKYDPAKVIIINEEFENVIDKVSGFISYGTKPFAFLFVDPTGWTGFGLNAMSRLLKGRFREILINFMTKDIRRFIDSNIKQLDPSFEKLYGTKAFQDQWKMLQGQEREDAMVKVYCHQLREIGGFSHVVSSPILNPKKDTTHFHLVYGTNSLHGLIVFRDVERRALQVQESIRAAMEEKKEEILLGNFLPGMSLGEIKNEDNITYVEKLIERYTETGKVFLLKRIYEARTIRYDDLLEVGLQLNMISEHLLRNILAEWVQDGIIRIEGLGNKKKPEYKNGQSIQSLN